MWISPLAHIENASIGIGTKVYQFASVIRDAHVGRDCIIGAGAVIDGAWVGDNCVICSHASLSPSHVLGNRVFIAANVSLCNDMWPSVDKDGFNLTDRVTVHIGDGAAIGANAVLLPGAVIGNNAVVAAGAVVDCCVPHNFIHFRNGMQRLIRSQWRERRVIDVDGFDPVVGCD